MAKEKGTNQPETTQPAPATTDVAKQEQPISVRFTNMVLKEFGGAVGEPALTQHQKRLAQNYFIATDQALVKAEIKRMAKAQNKRDPVPVTWENVNMKQLALDVVAAARVGLDPAQRNHVSLVPYKNNTTKKYDIGFIDGYRGLELVAIKYGLDVPDSVTVELVHANDHFRPIKKDHRNKIESYEFEIENPFDRGEIIGGFYYHAWNENPTKNRLVMFTMADIQKRKPAYAAPEFWGGEKDRWEGGQKVGKETVDGWFEKMCHKTIYRAAFRDITIDSQKIDDDYLRLKQMEDSYFDVAVDDEIAGNANGEIIDIDVTDPPAGNAPIETKKDEEPPEKDQKETANTTKTEKPEPTGGQQQIGEDGGPGY